MTGQDWNSSINDQELHWHLYPAFGRLHVCRL